MPYFGYFVRITCSVQRSNICLRYYPLIKKNRIRRYNFIIIWHWLMRQMLIIGPRQANLVLIAYASSEGSDEPAPRQNLRCSLIQAVSQEEPSHRKPDPWPLWMAGHVQLKFVMTECSKTQIRLTGLNYSLIVYLSLILMYSITCKYIHIHI